MVQEEDAQPLTQPIIAPVEKKKFAVQEADLPGVRYSREFMTDLMNLPEQIRNVALVGHLHHGKTAFADMLVLETHDISDRLEKRVGRKRDEQLRYTDIHIVERERGVSWLAQDAGVVVSMRRCSARKLIHARQMPHSPKGRCPHWRRAALARPHWRNSDTTLADLCIALYCLLLLGMVGLGRGEATLRIPRARLRSGRRHGLASSWLSEQNMQWCRAMTEHRDGLSNANDNCALCRARSTCNGQIKHERACRAERVRCYNDLPRSVNGGATAMGRWQPSGF